MYSLHTHKNIISLHSESMWNTYTNKINSKQTYTFIQTKYKANSII